MTTSNIRAPRRLRRKTVRNSHVTQIDAQRPWTFSENYAMDEDPNSCGTIDL